MISFRAAVQEGKTLQKYWESIGVQPPQAVYLASSYAMRLYVGEQDFIIAEVLKATGRETK